MIIGIVADHAGYDLKGHLITFLHKKHIETIDYGTNNKDPIDYPLVVKKVYKDVGDKSIDLLILICGTGVGVSIAANRDSNIRAIMVDSKAKAIAVKNSNRANAIALGSRFISVNKAKKIVWAFINN